MKFTAKCIGISKIDKDYLIASLKGKLDVDDKYTINNKKWKVCKIKDLDKVLQSSKIILCDIEPKLSQIKDLTVVDTIQQLIVQSEKTKEKEYEMQKVDVLQDIIDESSKGSFITTLNYFLYKSSVDKNERTKMLILITDLLFKHYDLNKFCKEFEPFIKLNRERDKKTWNQMIDIIKETEIINYCKKIDVHNPIFPTSCKCKVHDIRYFLVLYNTLNMKVI